jgi:hypothetical protein
MFKAISLFCLLSLLPLVGEAQDTCKVFSQKNPHGAEMWIYNIWIRDSVNFRVRSIQTLPWFEGVNDTLHFEVCILARDGKKHTTQVGYFTTHDTVTYLISNFQAPAPSAVDEFDDVRLLYPNPARDYLQLNGHKGDWSVIDYLGRVVLEGESEKIDVRRLSEGVYSLRSSNTLQRFVVVR